jgi:MFS family permease
MGRGRLSPRFCRSYPPVRCEFLSPKDSSVIKGIVAIVIVFAFVPSTTVQANGDSQYAYGLFELKTMYLASVVLFEAGSALCGGAPTMEALIVGRVLAGAGGAGMYLGCLNYLGVFTTLRERSFYNSLIGLVW